MNETTKSCGEKGKFKGKAAKAIIITLVVFAAAVALIVSMACCTPRDRDYEATSGNIIDIINYETGEWLYATSDGSVVRMKNNDEVKDSFDFVAMVKDNVGDGNALLRKIYQKAGSKNLWGIVSKNDSSGASFLIRVNETETGLELLDCVSFRGNVDNTFFLEDGDYLYLVCTGQQIAEIMRYKIDDLAAGTLCRTYLYDCTLNDDARGNIKLRAVQMTSGISCFESDGEHLYIVYDGGVIRLAHDFTDVEYSKAKNKGKKREDFLDSLDTEKYLSFGIFGVSPRGAVYEKETDTIFIVDRSSSMYYFNSGEINSLEIGEDLTCKTVEGVMFDSAPALRHAVYYNAKTKKGYVLHESSSLITRMDFGKKKIDFSFNLEFNIDKIEQGASANDIYFLYKNINKTGQAEKTILTYTNAELKRNTPIFRGFMIAGICIALVSAIVAIVLSVIVFKGKQQQALKVLSKIYRQRFIYIALIPSLILLMTFCYYEAIASIALSFFDYTLESPTMIWNNFANYIEVFTSNYVGEAFGNMVLFLCFDLFVALVPPLLFAFFLRVMKWEKLSNAVRTLLFITGVVPSVAGMLIWRTGIYGGDGVLNTIIKAFGGEPIAFLGQTAYAKWAVLFIGFPFVGAYLIFYGGMMNISSSYYEAAELEGIGIWKRFFYIDIPLIVPQIKYVFITAFIHSLQNFARTYMVTGGQFGTYTPIHIMYQNMVNGNYGLASAYATVIFVLLFFATFLNLRKQKKSLED